MSATYGRCPACGALCRQEGPVWAPVLVGEPVVHETYTCTACRSTRVAVGLDLRGRATERHVIDVERRVSWTTMGDP